MKSLQLPGFQRPQSRRPLSPTNRFRHCFGSTFLLGRYLVCFALGIIMAVDGFGYWALVGSTIAAPAINTASMWAITAWMPGMPRRGVGIYSMLRFGGTITLNNLVVYFAYNFDKLLLGRFWGADAL